MAEAWGTHPEDIMRRPRGALWARRWGVYREVRGRIEKGGKPAAAAPDGEPEWAMLERLAREQGSGQ